MRPVAIPLVVFPIATLLAGCDPLLCATPAGCLSARRLGGACGCAEWETVRTEEVAVPYVVSGVDFEPTGTATVLRYGISPDPGDEPTSSSSGGTSVRFVVRRPDGAEQVALLGGLPERHRGIERVSGTVLRSSARRGSGRAW